ncbi:MAG: dentilisin complex serine proteinase subunit PrtP [Treponema sp.]
MRKFLFLAVISLFACTSTYQNDKSSTPYTEAYIVKTIKGFQVSLFNEVGALYNGLKPNTNLLIDGEFYTVGKPNNIGEKEFIETLESIDGVYYACANRKIKVPDVIFGEKPSIKPFGLDAGNLNEDKEALYYEYALQITHARDWIDLDGKKQKGAYTEVGYGSNQVVVAIIDSGLNMNHEDFKRDGKSICLYAKEVSNLGDFHDIPIGSNYDIMGHGTHCSGTMCAIEGNNEGIAGVAYKNTHIISYKVLGTNETIKGIYGALGDLTEITTILKKDPSIRTQAEKEKIPPSVPQDFRITQKTIPVNMSLGHSSLGQYEVEMINLAISHDVLPVVSMGNSGRKQLTYPRSIKGCLAVGATTAQDKRASFSEAGESMSVSAPGAYIISTYNGKWVLNQLQEGTDRTGTQFMSGTSMAAPFVTGTIGYLLSFDEGQKLSPYQIKRLLEETADKIDEGNTPFGTYTNGHSLYYGYGRVNVLEAARCVEKKSGAKPIPEEDSFYLTKPLTIKTPASNTKVYLYEVFPDASLFLQGIAITNKDKTTYFYGLKNAVNYRVTSYVGGTLQEYDFTASKTGIMEHIFN